MEMEWGGEYSLDASNLDCLLNILPGELEFQQILGDIDEKIKKNTSSVEQCLKELQLEINETCSDELLQDTSDCLQWLNNCSFSSIKPLSTPHGELIRFLQTMQNLLKNEQNQEEIILHFLLDLSSQCGVLFPCIPSGASFEFTSNTSLHGVEDDSTVDVQCIWNDVRLHLRRFLVNQLQNQEKNSGTLQQQLQFKIQCLQQLSFLYPESEVLAKYQKMQNKLVSDLLQKCVLESSGETNFEKMVHGYENSIPVLCAMIKEDLYILNGIIDPPSTVKFINETYLDTITEEMTILLETLCELQFKENALHGVKSSKSSKKHRGVAHVGAAQEYSRKGRNFCLTLHQLRCLSRLINRFLLMEEKVEELSSEMLLLPCFSESKNVQGVLKKASGELLTGESRANEISALPDQLLQVKKSTILEFGWRNAFKDLSSSVAHCITIAVEDFSSKILQQEQNEQTSATSYVMHLVNVQYVKEYWGIIHEDERPKQISKFCSDIMEELDTLLPLALACRDESLQEIRADFVEACCKVATAVMTRLEERSKDIPSRAPLQNLYTILSTAVHVYQHFKIYHSLMKESNRKPLFLVPLQQYEELISLLQFQVTNYCIRVCATSILQDAESHYWDDSKAFYEGERCSFSVQMWHYFCCALHHDLWTVLPPALAQEILKEVLEKSLALLACRYFQAQPSYKRTPQIRIDVTAILMTCEKILWSVCGSVQELLSPHIDKNPHIYKVHRHCNNLLAAAVILTTPLENLYKMFQSNCSDTLPSEFLEPIVYQPLFWISGIIEFCSSLLKTPPAKEMAAQGQLKLLLSQPYCNWNLLLETLLHHDCLLLKILLRSSKSELPEGGEQKTCVDINYSKKPSLTEAIFTVLSYCTLSPKSLGSVLQNFMEKEQMWEYLCNISVSSCAESEPEVIRCLKLTLINSVKGIVKQIISLMHSWEATENYGTYQHKQIVPESLLKTVPKEWNYTPREMKRKESGKCFTRLAAHAVSIVISKLPTVIGCLPPPIKYFFFLSEKKMSKNFIESKKAGLLVWMLIVIICRIFEDGNTTELLMGTTLNRWSKEKLNLVRICLESIIGKKKSSPKQVTHKIIQSIEQQRPNWIENQLLKARKLSIDCTVTTAEDERNLEEEAIELELTEQKINMMVLDICHKPGGSEYLRQIYHIIQLNEEYLNEQLSNEGSEDGTASIRPLNLTLRSKEGQPGFDPFHVHYSYCTNVLEKFTITEWKWDWSHLLPSYLGLNRMTFRELLAHRSEFFIRFLSRCGFYYVCAGLCHSREGHREGGR
ncbi:uncharacterized protein KIAA0825 homolog isoform X2 [Sceloporus undulatus]|uniref:uncharacterized protein KIAA0825 homolog isoform X2 n=1 Tax=Sceloporus undulatus TaxID=8520 RepID=UPI001C4BC098|nr:uncharacterized protein KIAA0825 homolog isoform X2 [Sceloporus undulatus]